MDTLAWIAILGRRDAPTDALDDYCRLLGKALVERGCRLELVRVPWAEQGWRQALVDLERQVAGRRGDWALVQYTALAWSYRGFPLGFLRLLRCLKRAGLNVAIVFHDPKAFPGSRLRDRLRSRVQLAVMRRSASLADRIVSTISPECVPWMQAEPIRSQASLVPVASNVYTQIRQEQSPRRDAPVVAVFGVTQHKRDEAAHIAQAVRRAQEECGPVRLVVFGRGAELAQATLREFLEGSQVSLEVHGLLPPEQIGALLAKADVQLFVRSGISSRRGSAVAGIACGLPIVGFADEETSFPITEAGIRTVPRGDWHGLVRELVAVLRDDSLRSELAARSRAAQHKYFSWDAIAQSFLRVLANDAR